MEGPPPDPHPNTHTGRIGERGIPTKTGFPWVTDGPDTPSSLGQWAQDYLRQHEQLGVLDENVIRQATMRTISIKTTNLPTMRGLLQQSMTCPNEHTISKDLTNAEDPWENDNRDSVLEQGYETSFLPPETYCPNKDFTQGMPVVVSGIRNIDNPAVSTTPEVIQERYLD
jgi:hypothetical protein